MPSGKQLFAVILSIYLSLPISRWGFVLQFQFLNRIKKNHWPLICFAFSYCKRVVTSLYLLSLLFLISSVSTQLNWPSALSRFFFCRSLCPLKTEFLLDALRFLAIPDPSNYQIFHSNLVFLVAYLFYVFIWPPMRHAGS